MEGGEWKEGSGGRGVEWREGRGEGGRIGEIK